MWYWMRGYPAQSYVESYRRANRSVWVQELEIPPAARCELLTNPGPGLLDEGAAGPQRHRIWGRPLSAQGVP